VLVTRRQRIDLALLLIIRRAERDAGGTVNYPWPSPMR